MLICVIERYNTHEFSVIALNCNRLLLKKEEVEFEIGHFVTEILVSDLKKMYLDIILLR